MRSCILTASTRVCTSFPDDRIFDKETASINMSLYFKNQTASSVIMNVMLYIFNFVLRAKPLALTVTQRSACTYPLLFKTKQQGNSWWMNAQRTRTSWYTEGLPADLTSSGITFKLQHNPSWLVRREHGLETLLFGKKGRPRVASARETAGR